jgi:hypothetical protein
MTTGLPEMWKARGGRRVHQIKKTNVTKRNELDEFRGRLYHTI